MPDLTLFAALDVSLEKTTLCLVTSDGTIAREAVVPPSPRPSPLA